MRNLLPVGSLPVRTVGCPREKGVGYRLGEAKGVGEHGCEVVGGLKHTDSPLPFNSMPKLSLRTGPHNGDRALDETSAEQLKLCIRLVSLLASYMMQTVGGI